MTREAALTHQLSSPPCEYITVIQKLYESQSALSNQYQDALLELYIHESLHISAIIDRQLQIQSQLQSQVQSQGVIEPGSGGKQWIVVFYHIYHEVTYAYMSNIIDVLLSKYPSTQYSCIIYVSSSNHHTASMNQTTNATNNIHLRPELQYIIPNTNMNKSKSKGNKGKENKGEKSSTELSGNNNTTTTTSTTTNTTGNPIINASDDSKIPIDLSTVVSSNSFISYIQLYPYNAIYTTNTNTTNTNNTNNTSGSKVDPYSPLVYSNIHQLQMNNSIGNWMFVYNSVENIYTDKQLSIKDRICNKINGKGGGFTQNSGNSNNSNSNGNGVYMKYQGVGESMENSVLVYNDIIPFIYKK